MSNILSIAQAVLVCDDNCGGTLKVVHGTIRPSREVSQVGRPMGVQPWSYDADNADQFGVVVSPCGTGRPSMAGKYLDHGFVGFVPMEFSDGYLVSLNPPMTRVPECDAMRWEYVMDVLSPETLYAYVIHHLTAFDCGAYLGVWLNDGKWYLDCTVHVASMDEAMVLGKAHDQKAIWDCANSAEIFLKSSPTTGPLALPDCLTLELHGTYGDPSAFYTVSEYLEICDPSAEREFSLIDRRTVDDFTAQELPDARLVDVLDAFPLLWGKPWSSGGCGAMGPYDRVRVCTQMGIYFDHAKRLSATAGGESPG